MVHGITCVDGKLFQRKIEVPAVDLKTGFQSFIDWLKKFEKPLLVAHNGDRFDFPIILRAAVNHELLEDLKSTLYAMVDTLPVYKRKYSRLSKFTLDSLIDHFGVESFTHHDALEDSIALLNLITKSKLLTEELMSTSYTLDHLEKKLSFKTETYKLFDTFNNLVSKGIVPKAAAMRAAESGLTVSDLKSTYENHGESGLYTLLQQPFGDVVRVTKQKRDIDRILSYYKKYCKPKPTGVLVEKNS